MHGSFTKPAPSAAQAEKLAAPGNTSSATTTRRKTKRASTAKAALGPMSEAARLEMYDWLVLQVGRTADRPHGYHRIAQAMTLHFSDSDGKAWPSLVTLGEGCGMSEGTAAAMVRLLEADGHVGIIERGTPGRGNSTKYKKLVKPLPDDVETARKRVGLGSRRRQAKSSAADVFTASAPELKPPETEVLADDAAALKPPETEENLKKKEVSKKERKQERGEAAARTADDDRLLAGNGTKATAEAAASNPAFISTEAAPTPADPQTPILRAAEAAQDDLFSAQQEPPRQAFENMGTAANGDGADAALVSTRRIGQLIALQKATVGLAKGGRPITGGNNPPVIGPPTLAAAGIDKDLAKLARNDAALADERKDIVASIKKLQPKASNRKIAKVVGTSHTQVARDLGTNVPDRDKKAAKNKEPKQVSGTNVPPALSGAAAAKAVESKETTAATREAKEQGREDRRDADAQPFDAKHAAFERLMRGYPQHRVGDESEAYREFCAALAAAHRLSAVVEAITNLQACNGANVPMLAEALSNIARGLPVGLQCRLPGQRGTADALNGAARYHAPIETRTHWRARAAAG